MAFHLVYGAVTLCLLMTTPVTGCLQPEEAENKVTCHFDVNFCSWHNIWGDNYDWQRMNYRGGHGKFAGVHIWWRDRSAILSTDWICASTGHYNLSFQNFIYNDHACELSVRLEPGSTLWSTNHGDDFSLPVQPVTFESPSVKFKIKVEAKRFWQRCGPYDLIGIDNVKLIHIPETTTTTSTTMSSRRTTLSTTPFQPTSTSEDLTTPSNQDVNESSVDRLAVGAGVSLAVVAVVVFVVIVIVVLRRRKKGHGDESPGLLHCWGKKRTPKASPDVITSGVSNAAYSRDADPDSVRLATNGMDNTYAKVNKPKKGGDVYSVPNKGPTAAASRGVANSDVYHELEGDGGETDHYSVPDDADSGKRKGDNGYELAAAKLSMAPNTTPRNTGLNKAKGSVGSKTSRGFNPGAEREDEYNKLSLQTPRVASPAIPDTDYTYNHLDEHKHGVPTDQTGGNEYSLAKPDEAVSSKSTGNSRRQDYVNVNPNTSPREDEYHSLDFDSGHAPNSAVRSTGTTGGQDEYNHLQADGPGFRVQGEDDHYNALDFDSHGQVQKGDDGMVYSHLDDDQSAV